MLRDHECSKRLMLVNSFIGNGQKVMAPYKLSRELINILRMIFKNGALRLKEMASSFSMSLQVFCHIFPRFETLLTSAVCTDI